MECSFKHEYKYLLSGAFRKDAPSSQCASLNDSKCLICNSTPVSTKY